MKENGEKYLNLDGAIEDQWMVYEDEEERQEEIRRLQRRRERRAEMRRRRRRQVMINRCLFGTVCLLILLGVGFGIKSTVTLVAKAVNKDKDVRTAQGSDDSDLYDLSKDTGPQTETIIENVIEIEEPEPEPEPEPPKQYEAHLTDSTVTTGDNIISEKSILIDLDTGDILMQKGYNERCVPASMTKVLTVLVAAEHLTEEQLNGTYTITPEITSYTFKHGLSAVGFKDGEVVPVIDLFYGTILPSGADAAVGLAEFVAGSHEAFVDMMNEKVAELGLSETSHFTNCVGLYDDDHYSTVYDIAMIMEAALDNEFLVPVLSERHYVTTPTAEHPDGIELSNWFLRRIEDKDTGGEIVAAKTGYVKESKSCAVSYGIDSSGNRYVACTQHSSSSWRCIYDHVAMYKQFEGKTNHGSGEKVSDETIEESKEEFEAEISGN